MNAKALCGILCAILAAGVLSLSGCRKGAGTSSSSTSTQSGGASYDAFVAAQAFCHAWKKGDYAAAKRLSSSRLIERYGEDRVKQTIQQVGNIYHADFSLDDSGSNRDGKMEFKVRLDFVYRGQMGSQRDSQSGAITLAQEGVRWLVTDFPVSTSLGQ